MYLIISYQRSVWTIIQTKTCMMYYCQPIGKLDKWDCYKLLMLSNHNVSSRFLKYSESRSCFDILFSYCMATNSCTLFLWCPDVEWRASQDHPAVPDVQRGFRAEQRAQPPWLESVMQLNNHLLTSQNGLITLCLIFTCNRQMHCKLQMFCTYFVYLLAILLLQYTRVEEPW